MTGKIGIANLQAEIEALFDAKLASYSDDARQVFIAFRQQLNEGKIRAAEPDETQPTGWRVNSWVKKGILLGFRMGKLVHLPGEGSRQFLSRPPPSASLLGMALDVSHRCNRLRCRVRARWSRRLRRRAIRPVLPARFSPSRVDRKS